MESGDQRISDDAQTLMIMYCRIRGIEQLMIYIHPVIYLTRAVTSAEPDPGKAVVSGIVSILSYFLALSDISCFSTDI